MIVRIILPPNQMYQEFNNLTSGAVKITPVRPGEYQIEQYHPLPEEVASVTDAVATVDESPQSAKPRVKAKKKVK